MRVKTSLVGLKETRWYEFAVRFALGGLVTAGAGIIAKFAGPSFGGLFLAFPAILAASATLVAKHAEEEKQLIGKNGKARGRHAAGADAAGAAMGSIGLVAFAAVVYGVLPHHSAGAVIAAATLLWGIVCICAWSAWKSHFWKRRRKQPQMLAAK